jgi:hypothetical protein
VDGCGAWVLILVKEGMILGVDDVDANKNYCERECIDHTGMYGAQISYVETIFI